MLLFCFRDIPGSAKGLLPALCSGVTSSRFYMGCQRSNLGHPHARQASHSLYYCSGPESNSFLFKGHLVLRDCSQLRIPGLLLLGLEHQVKSGDHTYLSSTKHEPGPLSYPFDHLNYYYVGSSVSLWHLTFYFSSTGN